MLRSVDGGVEINIRVVPNGKVSEVLGLHGEALRVRLHAPPVDGKANAELLSFMADLLGVSPRQVTLKQGKTSRLKTILVSGIDENELRRRFSARGFPA